jgi:hypothetical protein
MWVEELRRRLFHHSRLRWCLAALDKTATKIGTLCAVEHKLIRYEQILAGQALNVEAQRLGDSLIEKLHFNNFPRTLESSWTCADLIDSLRPHDMLSSRRI